jgi:hypothetical protein
MAAILPHAPHTHVAYIVQPVFDGLMGAMESAMERRQAAGISCFCRQTGDQRGDFDAAASGRAAMRFDARDGRRAWSIERHEDF